jgi:PAS domain S-box-containing protein
VSVAASSATPGAPVDHDAGRDLPASIPAHRVGAVARVFAPFAAVVAACALSPALPHHPTPNVRWWGLAVMVLAALFAVIVLGVARRSPRLVLAAPLLLIPAVQLLRAADGNGYSGFNSMLMLPILWFALYGSRRLVLAAVALSAATLLLPLVLVGAPQYPATSARGVALLLFVMTCAGLILHRLVDTARAATARSAADSERFQAVFEHAPVGMGLTAGEFSPATRFNSVNRSLCALLGRTPDALTAIPVLDLIEPGDLDELSGALTGDRPAEIRFRHRAGHPVWATVTCAAVHADATHEPQQVVWQVEDISAHRAADVSILDLLDTERRAARALRVAEREHRQLLASISHDLRTPITAALGYAELLADGEYGPLTTAQQRTTDVITRSLGNLSRIINELVVIGPELAKGDTQVMTELQVPDLVEEALQLVAIQASLRNQHIRYDQGDDPLVVSGDAVRLNRVLVNLLGNAVKFTPIGGTITVTTGRDGTYAAIAVADSGPGIAEPDQNRIFERFYRAPRETNDPITRGSGLGLAIVKAITAQHSGTITVDSTPERGATFIVRLPLVTKQAAPAAPPSGLPTVLVTKGHER